MYVPLTTIGDSVTIDAVPFIPTILFLINCIYLLERCNSIYLFGPIPKYIIDALDRYTRMDAIIPLKMYILFLVNP